MSDQARILSLAVPDELVEAVAQRVAEILAATTPPQSVPDADPWLDVDAAAVHLACKPKRIYDLCSQRRVQYAKDGSRTLIRRSWLDVYLDGESAVGA